MKKHPLLRLEERAINEAEKWLRYNRFALQGIADNVARFHTIHNQANVIAKLVEDLHIQHRFTWDIASQVFNSPIIEIAQTSALKSLSLYQSISIDAINRVSVAHITSLQKAVKAAPLSRFLEMFESYQRLLGTIQSVPTVARANPSVEMYLASRQVLSSTEETDILEEDHQFLTEIEPGRQWTQYMIASVDPRLVRPYEGAVNALESDNVDRFRHFSVSSRELIRELILKLAPDEAVLKWNQDDSDLHQGRPTRRGRLQYICRNIKSGEFKDFVDKDIEAALAFWNSFEKGVHEIESEYNEEFLQDILIRMESLVVFLIRICKGDSDNK